MAQGEVVEFFGFFTPTPATCAPNPTALLAFVGTLLPLKGDGLSSLDFLRFSGRGTENVVGDVEGVLVTALVDMLILDTDEFLDARPFGPPLRSLLCTELLVSVKFIKSFVDVTLLRPLLPRPPLGNRESNSSVGESQNLGGAQSCFVQSMRVPT